ncbi:MAG TPA: response regulator, partial [Bacteroidia bacterium]|nr:response regulator [Bacteroidia bacterium]
MADQNLRILLVEDEQTLSETIKLNLEMEGYYVNAVGDGKTAIKVFKEARYNLVILDVMLPEISGFTVCEAIRLENLDVPILFLSAKNHPNDRITGLKLGGDDYLTKPFNLEELLLRVHNLIKRSTASKEVVALSTYNLNNNQINFAQL